MPTASKRSSKTNAQKSIKGNAMPATTQIISSNLKTTTAKNDSRSRSMVERGVDGASEITPFESSLFKDGKVDFKNYVEVSELFTKLSDEAKLGVDVVFADYQTSLIHLLKHCYGYFYALKNDKKRYEADIQVINKSISKLNKNSNSKNPLEMKIIKLAWGHNPLVDRRRLSTYAKTLTNAWCKGERDVFTDENGSVKPERFFELVMSYGGVQAFSRQSQKSLQEKAQLEKEGYKCLGDKKIDSLREALTTGTLLWEGVTKKLKTPSTALKEVSLSKHPRAKSLNDGDRSLFFCQWDAANQQHTIFECWPMNGVDSKLRDQVELEMFNELLREGKSVSNKTHSKSQSGDEEKKFEAQLTTSEYQSLVKAEKVQLYLGIEDRRDFFDAANEKLDKWDIADDEREAVRKAQLVWESILSEAIESLPAEYKDVERREGYPIAKAKTEIALQEFDLAILRSMAEEGEEAEVAEKEVEA